AQIVSQEKLTGEPFDQCASMIQRMLKSQSHGPASQALNHLIASFPNNARVIEIKGDLEEARGHEEAALESRLACIDLYQGKKEFQNALAILDRALRYQP